MIERHLGVCGRWREGEGLLEGVAVLVVGFFLFGLGVVSVGGVVLRLSLKGG